MYLTLRWALVRKENRMLFDIWVLCGTVWILCGIVVYGWCYWDTNNRWLALANSVFGPVALALAYLGDVRRKKRFDVIHLKYRK